MAALKQNRWRLLIIILVFIAAFGRYQHKMPKRKYADFHVYYYTAQRLLHHKNIYDASSYRKDRIANFKYPPLCALIFLPLGLLPERIAASLWFSFNFLLLILCFYWSGFLIFDKHTGRGRRNITYFLGAVFTLRFILYNFDEGQVNILMFSSLLFALVSLKKNRNVLAGAVFAFSSLVKYMSLLFFPVFLRRRRAVLAFLFSLIVFSVLPAFFLGWNYNFFLQKSFFPFLCHSSLDFNSLSTHENQSLMAMLIRFFSSFSPYHVNILNLNAFFLGFLVGAVYLFVYMMAFFPRVKHLNCEPLKYSFIFVAMALLNPNGWVHGFVYLLFPFMFLSYYLLEKDTNDLAGWFLVILSFLFSTWPNQIFLKGEDSTEIYSLLSLAGVILLGALMRVKLRKMIIPQ